MQLLCALSALMLFQANKDPGKTNSLLGVILVPKGNAYSVGKLVLHDRQIGQSSSVTMVSTKPFLSSKDLAGCEIKISPNRSLVAISLVRGSDSFLEGIPRDKSWPEALPLITTIHVLRLIDLKEVFQNSGSVGIGSQYGWTAHNDLLIESSIITSPGEQSRVPLTLIEWKSASQLVSVRQDISGSEFYRLCHPDKYDERRLASALSTLQKIGYNLTPSRQGGGFDTPAGLYKEHIWAASEDKSKVAAIWQQGEKTLVRIYSVTPVSGVLLKELAVQGTYGDIWLWNGNVAIRNILPVKKRKLIVYALPSGRIVFESNCETSDMVDHVKKTR